MSPYSLSRSSRLYKFVFGRVEGKVDGFPEPRNNSISLGLFIGLLLAATFLRCVSSVMILFMDALMRIVGFMIDGSHVRGSLLAKCEVIKIEPWPTFYGRRLSPWLVFVAIVVFLRYEYVGVADALEIFGYLTFTTVVFWCINPEEKTPSEELAGVIGPVVDHKLKLAYYRESKIFPVLQLVD